MSNRTITSKPAERIPVHVPVYNMLYADIINGLYKDGAQLPSETVLTEKYGVSRNAVRLALAILNEDGLVQKSQGKGTIVTYRGKGEAADAAHIFNPIIQCAKEEIDAIDIYYNYGPPTEVAQSRLGIKATEIVMASNNVYSSQGKPVGHAFIQIPVKHINDINVDLHSEAEVSNLINKTIFEMADSAKLTIRLVQAEENITTFLQIQPNEPVIYVEEILFTARGEGLARCKLYFLPDKYEIAFSI
ncbi:MAG: GntR family transcriptional regulator [Chloroflexota bacterium]